MSEDVKTIPIADLVPTQVTVGMREVEVRRRRWQEKHRHKADYLKANRFPVILGPGVHHYLVDRHHLALALQYEGVWEIPVSTVADLSSLSFGQFWTTLEILNWCHPFDDEGSRCSYDDMPTSVNELIDDPYRSLSGSLKRVGGYAKDKAPFSEFRWADYLRCRIPRELVVHQFGRALALAMNLAQSTEAAALPGWRRNPVEVAPIG